MTGKVVIDMAKRGKKLGVASVIVAGAGAAALMAKKSKENEKNEKKTTMVNPDYRNTERGKNAKNSKGIYYSNGNY